MGAARALSVDASNREQLRAWDGDEGAYWAAHPDYFDRSMAFLHQRLFAAAGIGRGERVLDIGCGTGQTTCDAARAAASGSALGVDLSSRMIEYARRRAEEAGVANARFEQADAQVHPFAAEEFDVAISRTGAMFFGDLVAAFTNIGRALRPGGRLALITWRPLPENEWIREMRSALAGGRDLPLPPADAQGPFSLSDPDRIRAVLTSAGFTDIELDAADADMWFGTDADDACRFVLGLLGWMLEGLDDAGRARALDALHATMTAHESADGVTFGCAAWTICATRRT